MNHSTPNDPYRGLFFLGGIVGILGVSIWLAFAYKLISYYPREAHANIMFFGLLWSFIAGFMMTAIPRMTQTTPAKSWERRLAIGLVVAQTLLSVLNLTSIAVYWFAAQTLFLVSFVAMRARHIQRIPFAGFAFLPIALFQAALGAFLFIYSGGGSREPVTLLCQEAFVLNLILGLGSRLIPVLSRIPKARLPNEIQSSEPWATSLLAALTLNATYWTQLLGWTSLGLQVRSVLVLAFCIWLLKWLKRPTQWTAMGVALKAATTCLCLGLVLQTFNFVPSIAAIHFLYIGGFGLITFIVSTRVVLAHGGQDLSFEVSSRRLWLMAALLLLAASFRFISGGEVLSPLTYLSAALFISATLIWISKFIQIEIASADRPSH